MTEGIWLAMIVALTTAITTTVTPVTMALLTARAARADRREDWMRQDAVAAKAAEAAKLLIAANQRVEASARGTTEKLDDIHVLVNSNMSALKEALVTAKQEISDLKSTLATKER